MKLPRLGLTALLLAGATALGQPLDETYVSGVGDDANPCDRVAPCLTLTGALAATVDGGTVILLDPATLPEATIRQGVTVAAARSFAGFAEPPLVNGLTIDAPGAKVVLRGLSFQANQSGTSGLVVRNVGTLQLERCRFTGFTADAIDARLPDGGSLFVDRTVVTDSLGAGLRVSSDGAPVLAVLRESSFSANGEGLRVGPGALVTLQDGVVAGNAAFGLRVSTDGGVAEVNVEGAQLVDNGVAIEALAGTVVRLSNSQVAGSATTPTHVTGSGRVESFGNNRFLGGSTMSCAAGAMGFDPVVLPNGLAGVPLMPVEFGSTGGLGPIRYGTTGALPAGVTIDAGVLSGAPLQTGTFAVTLTATDFNGCSATRAGTMTVSCPQVSVAPGALAPVVTGAVMTPVQFQLQGNTGTQTDVALTGALPIGVGFDGGVLSGRPTQAGSFPLTVSAMNEFGCTAQAMLSLDVSLSSTFQPTTLALSIPAAPVWVTAPLTVTAGIDAGTATATPTGTVVFSEGSTVLGSGAVGGGIALLNTNQLSLGTHRLTALYLGDETFGGSVAPELTVEVVKAPSAMTVDVFGTRLAIEVSSPLATPDGEVSVVIDGSSPILVPLDLAGRARLGAPTVAGEHFIEATYPGAARFLPTTQTLRYSLVTETDAGVVEEMDAGVVTGEPMKPTGCGCSGLEGSALVLGALGLLLRRRS